MKKILYLPDDAKATSAARFGEETQPGGGVVFNVKWRRYASNSICALSVLWPHVFHVSYLP